MNFGQLAYPGFFPEGFQRWRTHRASEKLGRRATPLDLLRRLAATIPEVICYAPEFQSSLVFRAPTEKDLLEKEPLATPVSYRVASPALPPTAYYGVSIALPSADEHSVQAKRGWRPSSHGQYHQDKVGGPWEFRVTAKRKRPRTAFIIVLFIILFFFNLALPFLNVLFLTIIFVYTHFLSSFNLSFHLMLSDCWAPTSF